MSMVVGWGLLPLEHLLLTLTDMGREKNPRFIDKVFTCLYPMFSVWCSNGRGAERHFRMIVKQK